MKRFLATGVLALCLMTSQIARAAEDQQAKTKAAMVAKYQLVKEAYENANVEDVEAELAPNFKVKLSNKQTLNRAQFVAMQRNFLNAVTKVHQVTLRINKVTVTSNRAVVVVTQYYDFELTDARGRPHRLKESSVARDTWVRVSGRWKNSYSEFLSGTATLDGKKITKG